MSWRSCLDPNLNLAAGLDVGSAARPNPAVSGIVKVPLQAGADISLREIQQLHHEVVEPPGSRDRAGRGPAAYLLGVRPGPRCRTAT